MLRLCKQVFFIALLALPSAFVPSVRLADASAPDKNNGGDVTLPDPVTREAVEKVALLRNPSLRAARKRVSAASQMAESERHLPPPEAEFQVWQIPLSRPYSLSDAQMIMVGLRQPIPAPGSLGARAEARAREGDVEQAMVSERVREIKRQMDHAFIDYVEATLKLDVMVEQRKAAERILAVAKARLAAGGPITDIAQADVEVAGLDVDIAEQQEMLGAAKAKLNALMLRPDDAPLGRPAVPTPETVAESVAVIVERAQRLRPEIKTAQAKQGARLAQLRAEEREASWPMFSVGALYFAPTHQMPSHGYGVSLSSSLPWLWGKGRAAVRAERTLSEAAGEDTQDALAKVNVDVTNGRTMARTAARRLSVLQAKALPAGKRAFLMAASGYESGRADMLSLLMARKSIVDIELRIVDARVALDHALVDLDWASGTSVQRVPVSSDL